MHIYAKPPAGLPEAHPAHSIPQPHRGEDSERADKPPKQSVGERRVRKR